METQTALKKMPRGAKVKELLLKNFAFAGLLLVIVLFEILTQGRLLGQKNLLNIGSLSIVGVETKTQIIRSCRGRNAPARFLCMAEQNPFSEI